MKARHLWFAAGVQLIACWSLAADPVPVHYLEGRIRGFLTVRDLENNVIGTGDLFQSSHGSRMTTRLTLRLKDGSVYDETAVFSQQRFFHLLTDHVSQKGPAFKRPMDMTMNVGTGAVTVRYTDDHGNEKVIAEHLKMPDDVANGLLTTLLVNIDPKALETTVSIVAATPKPRVAKLKISPAGEDAFTIGGTQRKAMKYQVKVDIGGVSGVIAPLVGKQPPDTQIWLIGAPTPGFLKSEGPMGTARQFGGLNWLVRCGRSPRNKGPGWCTRIL